MGVLVLNSGSSSLTFRILEVPERDGEEPNARLQTGLTSAVKGIGGQANLQCLGVGRLETREQRTIGDHAQAAEWMFEHVKGESLDAALPASITLRGRSRHQRWHSKAASSLGEADIAGGMQVEQELGEGMSRRNLLHAPGSIPVPASV